MSRIPAICVVIAAACLIGTIMSQNQVIDNTLASLSVIAAVASLLVVYRRT